MVADQWGLDTLSVINEKRRCSGNPSFKWNGRLEEEARVYLVYVDAWEFIGDWASGPRPNLDKVPRWVQEARVEITTQAPDGGIVVCSPGDFTSDTAFTAIVRGRHFEYKHNFSREGGTYYRRPLQPDYVSASLWDAPKGSYKHIVCSCRCPHWTPPQIIADLLWSEHLCNCKAKSAAVVIKNDDRFTYVAFACK